jgi:hypothetical protein
VKIFSLKTNKLFVLFLIFFSLNIYSQSKVDNPLLLQTWKFKGLNYITTTYESQKKFDKKSISFRLKKNGKAISISPKPACGNAIIEELKANKLKFYRSSGIWKKISDSVIFIDISSPSGSVLSGPFVIKKLTGNELVLKRYIKPR